MHTPFFPEWRPRLAALGRHVQLLRRHSLPCLERLFSPFLQEKLLQPAAGGAHSRQRVFTLRRTVFGFLFQALNPACSCHEVVRQIQALFGLHDGPPVHSGTSAYCQARSRLPDWLLPRLRQAAATHAEKSAALWHGLRVKVIDGTGLSLPDTKANQRAYPQSAEQKPGGGFPLMKIVAVFSLASGTLLAYAKGNNHRHELNLLHQLRDQFAPEDLALADRGFSVYTLMALLWVSGVQSLFRLHHCRASDFRKGKRLGKKDRLLTWRKPQNWQRRKYLSLGLWNQIAGELSIRIVPFAIARPGFRTQSVTLVTTLLDARAFPPEEPARLYLRRWRIELWFRDIKATMGMEVLRCQSPRLIEKELEMFFLAYNLIRCLMVQASVAHGVTLERLSFKGTVDGVRQFSAALAQSRCRKRQKQLIDRLLQVMAEDQVPERPGRREPRAVKRRPKPFAKLTCRRHQFQEIGHRNRNWKNKSN